MFRLLIFYYYIKLTKQIFFKLADPKIILSIPMRKEMACECISRL